MTMYSLGPVLLLAAVASAGTPPQQPADSGKKVQPSALSLKEARKFLEGRWSLESFELRQAGKPPVVLKGSGVLTYDDFGNLDMQIRADQASSDLLRESGIEIRDGVISTKGRTAIDLQNRTLTYFIDGQRSGYVTGGGPLAMVRKRHWEVAGDVLTLTTKDDNGTPVSISRWKKVS